MKEATKTRGVFEKIPGSNVWWIRYTDTQGRERREKIGTKSAARRVRELRKADAWQGRKLPERLNRRVIRFAEFADDYAAHAERNNAGWVADRDRIRVLREAFGSLPADLPIALLRGWFSNRGWAAGTHNRTRTVLYSIFRLAAENGKIDSNPVKALKRQKEPEGRVRFLNQSAPDEEARLRKVILAQWPDHLPELDIAINSGLRRSEQYRLEWSAVDFLRRDLFVARSKNGDSRHIALNDEALAAFRTLHARTGGKGHVFTSERGGHRLRGGRHWFEPALAEAGIRDFTWHCLRHTFASRLVMAGVDIRTVAALLGHKQIQMTMRYAHLAPAHNQAAVQKLAEWNRLEKQAAILNSPAGNETGTETGTEQNRAQAVSVGGIQ